MQLWAQLDPDCFTCVVAFGGQEGFEACRTPPPPADFCVDPGSAANNPDGALYMCNHQCDVLRNQGDWEAADAAGCNDHEDEVCVSMGVQAPGEADQWGNVCCAWCGDDDGDGTPDYENCCIGMRADGEMGCEFNDCRFYCDGLECRDHGDQTACEAGNGVWEVDQDCENMIAMQSMWMSRMPSVAAPMWLGQYGDTCCTGYEAPGPGSCDGQGNLDAFVSSMGLVCLRCRCACCL